MRGRERTLFRCGLKIVKAIPAARHLEKTTTEENYDNAHYFRKLNKINITLTNLFLKKKNQLLNI